MNIYLASDHAGFELKELVKKHLQDKGLSVEDLGNSVMDENDDYPDFIREAAKKVALDESSMGVVFGKSGNGEAIVANKIKGVRCAVGFNTSSVTLAREHNNANMLSLGASFVDKETAVSLVDLFINTPFSNEERHKRRVDKIENA